MAKDKKMKRCPVSLQPDVESMLDCNSLTNEDFEPANQNERKTLFRNGPAYLTGKMHGED